MSGPTRLRTLRATNVLNRLLKGGELNHRDRIILNDIASALKYEANVLVGVEEESELQDWAQLLADIAIEVLVDRRRRGIADDEVPIFLMDLADRIDLADSATDIELTDLRDILASASDRAQTLRGLSGEMIHSGPGTGR